ncbi:MAG: DUF3459 domain-containing protein [Acidimicrobiia bacterium]|nr:DUF3459 domain-containing protein [Acidimicrobiia bacterium]
MYVRSFADANGDGIGDLAGIRSRLPHLKHLGVDLVWLTPFFPSPGFDHGYDVADYCDVDTAHGTLADFDDLVTEAYRLGLRVMIDLVPNHTSSRHRWFQAALADPTGPYRAYYHWHDPAADGGPPNNWVGHFGGPAWTLDQVSGQYYLHLFLPEQPDLNWTNPAVADEFDAILRFWCERGVDGFRVDVAHGLAKDPWLRDNPVLQPLTAGMDPIAAFAAFEHRYDLDQNPNVAIFRRWRRVVDPYRAVLLGETGPHDPVRLARYHDEGRALHLTFYLRPAWMTWQPMQLRDGLRGVQSLSPHSVAWTIENHDTDRAATRFGGGDTGRRRALAVTTFMFGLGGLPFLFQGQELGNENGLVAAGRLADPISTRNPGATSGRDGSRTAMAWDDTAGNGFTTGPVAWLEAAPRDLADTVAGQIEDPASWLNAYRRLIKVRRQHRDLVDAQARWLDTDNGLLLALQRTSVLVACNLDGRPADLTLPSGNWALVFSSAPDSAATIGTDLEATVTVPAETSLILVAG